MTRFHKLVLATLCGKLRVRVLLAKKKNTKLCNLMPRKPIEKPFSIAHSRSRSRSLRSSIVGSAGEGGGRGSGGGETTTPAAVRVNAVSKVFCLLLLPFGFCATSVKAPQCQQFHTHTHTHTDITRTQAHTPAHAHTPTCTHIRTHTQRDSHTLLN